VQVRAEAVAVGASACAGWSVETLAPLAVLAATRDDAAEVAAAAEDALRVVRVRNAPTDLAA
jgi:hypothetical protein